MQISPSRYFLIGSLRSRITVLIAMLAIALQAAFFMLAKKTAGEFDTSWNDSRAAHYERMLPPVSASIYRSLDSDLDRLLNRVRDRHTSEDGAIQWTVASLAYTVLKLDVQQVFVHNTSGKLLYPDAGASKLATRWLQNTERFKAVNKRAHSGYFENEVAYLTSTKPLKTQSEDYLITIATPAGESLLVELDALTGAKNTIIPAAEQDQYSNTSSGSMILPIDTFSTARIVSELPPTAAIFQLVEKQNTRLKILLATSLGVVLIVGLALAHELTKPLQQLIDATKKIQDGDYSEDVPRLHCDEIGELATTIDTMREHVAEREDKILELAYADPLTGLPNRALFDDRLNQAVRLGKRQNTTFAVLLLDMNRFKYINDVLGHEAGDKVLKEVGARLSTSLRESDTVARLGGDEFSLLLLVDSDLDILTATDKVTECFDKPVTLNNQPVDIGCSIGIAKYPDHGEDAGTLLRRADMAMYSAKRSDKSYDFYNPDCEEHQEKHLSLLSEIKEAIETDAFQLFFQPKVSFEDDSIPAVETLIRWQHPKRGLIPPDEFIPFSEQTGAIRLITRWVVKQAFKQASMWKEQDLKVKISVNISARDLLDPDFVEYVGGKLDENGIAPSMICMEITESALMEDPARARRNVEALSEMGLSLSIDDYGTGYSSLAYVKNLPVNELKIDREFIKNMIESEEDLAIVRSTIELGHNLGMRVVAEGIERAEEMDMLKEFGCDQAQGYLISRALNANGIEEWIKESKSNPNKPADRYGKGDGDQPSVVNG